MGHSIDKEQVRHVAGLARLALCEEDVARLADDLGVILEYMARLEELDTTGVEPSAHPLPLSNVLREDEPADGVQQALALANAPASVRGFFAVPRVLDGSGGA